MDSLFLKWISNIDNKKYIIGAICKKDDRYYFRLVKNYKELAKKINFPTNILPFNNENIIYESEQLFPTFKVMIPNVENYTKEELDELLINLNMKEYDEFEALKITKGSLDINNFVVEEN